jgi:tetratricopeptide (TPR) repeat protein
VAYTSEIEKLEKRWAENPKGRNFAPLADAYRKAGELDRAIELCKSGLERHPDYVSAHIVYGRCFLDLKNDTAASQVFRKVLDLDPENVLGLKLLADIAERGGRYDEAAQWLSRLLNADPMNGDAAEALVRTKGKAAQAAPKPIPQPVPAAMPPPAVLVPERPAASGPTTAPVPRPEFVVEHTPEEPVTPQLEVKPQAGDIETFDGTLDFNAVAHDAAKAEGLEIQEEVALKPQQLEVEGLAATQYESGTFAAPADATPEPEPDLPTVDLPLIMPEDVTPPRPPAVASPPSAVAPPQPAWPTPLTPPPPSLSPPPPAPPVAEEAPPAAVVLSDDDGAADTAALSRAEPVVTETMADLYLKQGHPEEALRVYQALLAQRPEDARLHARVDALSPGTKRGGGRGTGESVPTFLRRILAGRPQAPAASPLERAFAVAPSEAPRQPDDPTLGEASRPAEDTISLDQVFGDEGLRASPPVAEPAAPNPAASAPPVPGPTTTGGFSFDQFFGAPGARPDDGATPAGGAARGAARPSGPKPRPPLEDEGDLDQFQAWLKGLKS